MIPLIDVSDAEFVLHAASSVVLHCGESLVFNPCLYDENKYLINNMDLDPDINCCNNLYLPDSNYVTSSDLNVQRTKRL